MAQKRKTSPITHSLYSVNYTTAGGLNGHWEFYALNGEDAYKQAYELMPLSYKITSVNLSEEW
jgi:hypothetical protein